MTTKTKRPTVSVIIRCFNEERHIGKLLYGISLQQEVDFEVIIVDSGSNDRTLEIANRYPARVIDIDAAEFTFGRALNLGCAAAQGEYLLLASAHVYPVHTEWMRSIIKPFENPRIGAVYGKQRGGQGTKYSERRIFEHWFPDADIPVQDTPFCNNANCAVRRALWEQYPYDEELTGLEDLHFAQRIVQAGYRVSYVADAEVIHLHDETPFQTFNRYRREAIGLKQTYPDQDMSLLDFATLFARNVLSDYLNAALNGQLKDNIKEVPLFRLMQFFGAYTGLKQNGEVSEKLKQTFYYPTDHRLTGETARADALAARVIHYDLEVQPPPPPRMLEAETSEQEITR